VSAAAAPFAVRHFAGTAALVAAAADDLEAELRAASAALRAVLLSGGATPLPVYREVARRGVRAGPRVFAILGDERLVPEDSPGSNYGNLRPALEAWGLPAERIVRPRAALGPAAAEAQFEAELRAFLAGGGRVGLGLLGLGPDGHTASLFTAEDVARGAGRLAIAVPRPSGPARVSVTRGLLAQVARVVVLVADAPDKRAALATLLARPGSVAAGLALQGHADVQVWAGWGRDYP